jgi:hypothetical protein
MGSENLRITAGEDKCVFHLINSNENNSETLILITDVTEVTEGFFFIWKAYDDPFIRKIEFANFLAMIGKGEINLEK